MWQDFFFPAIGPLCLDTENMNKKRDAFKPGLQSFIPSE